MKPIDKLLPVAYNELAVSDSKLVDNEKHVIRDNVYDGYLAGFGPAVITSGLIQTLATYAADEKRRKVLDVIAKVAAIDDKKTGDLLLLHCLAQSNKRKLNIWRSMIINASVALKMMIRTYSPLNEQLS